ncbi:hypothetical protein [Nitrosomonas marina]|nr:hypothetical protein [Nitrosomonas marina]
MKIWVQVKYGDGIHALLFGIGNQVHGETDASIVLNNLHAYLIELACRNEWIAAGVSNRIKELLLGNTAAPCLLSLKHQQDQSGERVCPSMSEINDDTLKLLKEIAARETDSDIEPTFECKTSHSDTIAEPVTSR